MSNERVEYIPVATASTALNVRAIFLSMNQA